MVIILEKDGSKRTTLDVDTIEPFTQKPFVDLIRDTKSQRHDYFLVRITSEDRSINCYDARQLCRYVFEILISPDSRKVRIKNFKEPLTHKKITDLLFFRMRYDSETPLRAEYMGNHIDFLESNCFRSKLFHKEDPLYALSVNFNFKEVKGIPMFGRKQVFTLFITIMFILLISTFFILVFERDKGKIDKKMKHPSKIKTKLK